MNENEHPVELHTHMLQAHDDAIKNLSPLPGVINGLKASIDRLNNTMTRLDEKAQTTEACKATHEALNDLRREQLQTLRSDIEKLNKQATNNEREISSLRKDSDTATGAIFLLKWSIQVLVSVSIAAAKFI